MIKAIILGWLRHSLTGVGAFLTAWLLSHGANATDAGVIVSGLVMAAGGVLSAVQHYKDNKADGITWNGPRQGV